MSGQAARRPAGRPCPVQLPPGAYDAAGLLAARFTVSGTPSHLDLSEFLVS
ncbi:MAG TPA: hypothetical protein VK923_04300 [Euzebyales bacterium]|nr:hypothetical protein [Euzebyales bacterium]